jgi:hypothetical protein
MANELLCPPDVRYHSESDDSYRPSWSATKNYLGPEHAGIWHMTNEIPGFQVPADSEKLYEMAYYCGAAILEIGTYGGRSAVVELLGALRGQAERSGPRPQYYGIDVDLQAISRTYQTLFDERLADHALLFHGNLTAFHEEYPVTPTMVFVDGDHDYIGVFSDLDRLRTFLAPGTPVLCHDYWGYPGVKQAVDEWRKTGYYHFMGIFGCSALLRASRRCPGRVCPLAPARFECERQARLVRHLEEVRTTATEMQQHIEELSASRWRKLGLRLGLVKKTSRERARHKRSA